ncbi:hypothetical protein DFS34DRAFT_458837 [Phlyctochytrium arcticum]|nr:hypothetical protein DFS34DRAFT_458837 [Phlyctochytrium arcticum]
MVPDAPPTCQVLVSNTHVSVSTVLGGYRYTSSGAQRQTKARSVSGPSLPGNNPKIPIRAAPRFLFFWCWLLGPLQGIYLYPPVAKTKTTTKCRCRCLCVEAKSFSRLLAGARLLLLGSLVHGFLLQFFLIARRMCASREMWSRSRLAFSHYFRYISRHFFRQFLSASSTATMLSASAFQF